MNTIAVELKNISKTFGEVVANDKVDFTVYKGEILSILGENGSGKTTLMNILDGIYFPDEGDIYVNGEKVVMLTPKDAFEHKIGMIHQHFKLVNIFSAADNILLGEQMPAYSVKEHAEQFKKESGWYDAPNKDATKQEKSAFVSKRISTAFKIAALPFIKFGKSLKFNRLTKDRNEKIKNIADKYGFDINLDKKIYDMSVSEKQTVEIIKVLYRGADILILDEPTAVLTPQETEKLFDVLRKMRDDGKSILIITHKLNEVMEISDRVTVLRKGKHIVTVETSKTNEKELTEMMVGKKVELNIDRKDPVNPKDRLVVSHLSATNSDNVKVLNDVSFTAKSGEILGIAGIAGSGQKELLEAIAGLHRIDNGEITYFDPKNSDEKINLMAQNPMQIRKLGVRLSFVPEDRLGMGLVGNMDITDNMMLRSYQKGHSIFLNRKEPENLAHTIVNELEVSTPDTHTAVRKLSGGNVQKVLVGREIASVPTVLMVAYPVRGLDINSAYTIYHLLNQQKERGVAVIYVGEDLDVLIELCDRIMVICNGEITGTVDGKTAVKEDLGLLMTKNKEKETGGAEKND